MKPNIFDINIIDLHGDYYDINSIHVDGNDVLNIVIKKPCENYISRRKGRELIDNMRKCDDYEF